MGVRGVGSGFKKDVDELVAHADRYRSQYRRLREIKDKVSDPINRSKLRAVFFNFTQGHIQPVSDFYDFMICSSS